MRQPRTSKSLGGRPRLAQYIYRRCGFFCPSDSWLNGLELVLVSTFLFYKLFLNVLEISGPSSQLLAAAWPKPGSVVMHVHSKTPRSGGYGEPGEIRTPDPLLRRQMLYPPELRARFRYFSSQARPGAASTRMLDELEQPSAEAVAQVIKSDAVNATLPDSAIEQARLAPRASGSRPAWKNIMLGARSGNPGSWAACEYR